MMKSEKFPNSSQKLYLDVDARVYEKETYDLVVAVLGCNPECTHSQLQ